MLHTMTPASGGSTWLWETLRALSRRRTGLEERLRHQATHDPLTGLANRALLFESLEQALLSAKRNRHLVAVLFVDIDDVSPVLQKIQSVFARPFVFGDRGFLLTCSVGVAVYPKDGQDANTLLGKADSTMYRVKGRT
jgi:GGDEF domain-containing protein